MPSAGGSVDQLITLNSWRLLRQPLFLVPVRARDLTFLASAIKAPNILGTVDCYLAIYIMNDGIYFNFHHHAWSRQSGLNRSTNGLDACENLPMCSNKAAGLFHIRKIGPGSHHMLNLSTHASQCIGDPVERVNRLGIGIAWSMQLAAGLNGCCAGYIDEWTDTFSPDVGPDLLKPASA